MTIPSYLSGALFMKAHKLLRLEVATCLQRFNLTPTNWALLGIIKQSKNGIQLSEVAAHMSVKAPLITNLAQDMITHGHVQLISHRTDGRAKLLSLTPSGKEFIRKVETAMSEVLTKVLAGITEEELVTFKKVLETIVHNSNTKKS